MTVEQRKLEKDLCRCCHAEGSFKNLGISWYNPLGEEEIYSNMLREQLGLDIYPVSGLLSEVTYKICDPCIVRLRDATDFRKQVQTCEAKFSDLISKNVFQVAVPFVADVKVEMEEDIFEGMKAEDDDADDGFEPTNFDDDEDNKDEVQTLLQLKQETKKGKGKGKATAKTKAKPVAAKAKKATAKATKAKKAIKEETDAMIMELPAASGEAEKKKKGRRQPRAQLSKEDYRCENETYICNKCDKPHGNIKSLREHVLTKHLNFHRHLCSECPERFPTFSRLREHKAAAHNIREKFECTACDSVYASPELLRNHINIAHKMGKLKKCDKCDYETYSRKAIYNHRIRHGTNKTFACRFCQKAYPRRTTLVLHERIHTRENLKLCKVCNAGFVQTTSLKSHILKYHPEGSVEEEQMRHPEESLEVDRMRIGVDAYLFDTGLTTAESAAVNYQF